MTALRSANGGCDVALVGGGLANSLLALWLGRRRPELSVRIFEAEPAPPIKTWSVFRSDVSAEAWAELAPAFEAHWPGYEVHFPAHSRRLSTGYASLRSDRLADLLRATCTIETERVTGVAPDGVVLENGTRIPARIVVDGRGAVSSPHLKLGYQKFLGLELSLHRPHGLAVPIVMDATVCQQDGYRFVYVLPFNAHRLLIEDTRYSDSLKLDPALLETAMLQYAREHGWAVADVLRRESGVLPVVLSGDIDAYQNDCPAGIAQLGMRGLFFHPTTGYSLPDAARIAAIVASHPLASGEQLAHDLRREARKLWRQRSLYRALNRMLFKAAEPDQRYRILERFYTLPEPLIERFYTARTNFGDTMRILAGRPPVPIGRALAALAA